MEFWRPNFSQPTHRLRLLCSLRVSLWYFPVNSSLSADCPTLASGMSGSERPWALLNSAGRLVPGHFGSPILQRGGSVHPLFPRWVSVPTFKSMAPSMLPTAWLCPCPKAPDAPPPPTVRSCGPNRPTKGGGSSGCPLGSSAPSDEAPGGQEQQDA